MASLELYNSLTKKNEAFNPINLDGSVLMYTCGPTVYNYPHLGNYRSYIFADLLKRVLILNDFKVKQVINLTDVDDKTIKSANELGISLKELTTKYELDFYSGRESLNLLPAELYPRATNSIPKMIEIITALIAKGFAYLAHDGSVYFKVDQDKNYGKLVALDKDSLKQNASGRMNNDEYELDSIQDFALWKAYDETDGTIFWNSPWGKGRPGWHIECSAMAQEFLGTTIDIHTGGVDNMFPHHENEIAQSECANDAIFSNYFLHCEHLLIDGKKMAKRDGNFLMLDDLKSKSISSLAYKLFLYGTHYQTQANFTWDAVSAAETSLIRMYEKFVILINNTINTDSNIINQDYLSKIKNSLNNNLNSAEAIAVFIAIFDDENIAEQEKLNTILNMDSVLGLGFNEYYRLDKTIPENIQALITERSNARISKDYNKSDELRETLNSNGYIVIDTKDSSIIAINPLK